MLRTQNEANERWCPFTRVLREYKPSAHAEPIAAGTRNRDVGHHPGPLATNCIGESCMAWRQTRAGMVFEVGEQGAVFRQQKIDDPIYGYCGLAGKVEP